MLMKKRGRPPKKKPIDSFEEVPESIELAEIVEDGPFCDCGNVIDRSGDIQCNSCVRRA